MATDKPRILITVDSGLIERIDDYRYSNRIPARSKAIRELLDSALKQWEADSGEAPQSD